MLPNLIIIGAAKAGTTSLHHYLDQHPEIHMSPVKEPSFFTAAPWPPGTRPRGAWFRIGDRTWYEALFETTAPVRGEASPSYSMFPIVQGAADRIHAAVPDVRLIYLVRDPVERAVAHYAQRVQAEGERKPLREALGDPSDPRNPYVCPGRYATQLREYLRLFPPDRILVADQADLLHDRRAVLRRAFEFVGVDAAFDSPAFVEQHNVTSTKRARSPLYARVHDAVKEPVLDRMPAGLRRGMAALARPALTRPMPALDVDDGVRADLRATLAPEVRDLRSMTGLPLASWSL